MANSNLNGEIEINFKHEKDNLECKILFDNDVLRFLFYLSNQVIFKGSFIKTNFCKAKHSHIS